MRHWDDIITFNKVPIHINTLFNIHVKVFGVIKFLNLSTQPQRYKP